MPVMNRVLAPLAAILILLLASPLSPALAQNCAVDEFEGTGFVICAVDPDAAELRLFWADPEGRPYRHFSALARTLETEGRTLVFALNAGMYGEDYSPIGLYVENGEERRPVNTRVVEGPPAQVPNFYKLPNGVFYLDDAGAGILPTQAFVERATPVRFATQSGPMLVIDNQLHPAFIPGSSDRTRRSGVGVCRDGLVRFAISERNVNFHDFARLFRDHLACPDALFLDGGRGAGLYAPALRRNDWSWHGGFGPMFAIIE